MKVRLGSVCEFLNGGTPSKSTSKFFDGTVPWITSADIVGPVVSRARSFITDEAIKQSAVNLVRKGTVLLVTRTGVGKVAVAGTSMCFSQDITALLHGTERLDGGFLVQFLRTKKQHFERLSRGATIKGISRDVVADLEIPLPSLPDQRRIATILGRADALKAKRLEALAQMDKLTMSIFVDLFGDPVSNERGWPSRDVASLCNLVRGSSPRPQGDPRYFGGPVPRLMVADITRDGWSVTPRIDSLTIEGAKQSRPVEAGTVVMAVSGNVGVVSVLAIDACVHDGFVAFKNLDESVCESTYLLALLHYSKIVHEKSKAGAIFINLTTTDIKDMRLALPPVSLQREFARRLAKANEVRASQRSSLIHFDFLFASLQHRAFSGAL